MMAREHGTGVLLRRALVLGDGSTARVMAEDLARSLDLHVRLAEESQIPIGDAFHTLAGGFDVVLCALAPAEGRRLLRLCLEARILVADASTRIEDALALHDLALAKEATACVGCGRQGLAVLIGRADAECEIEDTRPDGQSIDARVAALMATALARRLLTGDFRGHWGVWTPERLAARVGMAHGILQDLRERGIDVRPGGA